MSGGTESAARSITEISAFLKANFQLSNATFFDSISHKVILVSAASNFEKRILFLLENCAFNLDARGGLILSLVKNKAIKRQYHSFFNWDELNLGSFNSLIGSKLSKEIKEKMKEPSFSTSVKSFLEIGSHRNHLVHNDFLSHSIIMTVDEVMLKVNQAEVFVCWLEKQLALNYPQELKLFIETSFRVPQS